jgi:hypothetical protein
VTEASGCGVFGKHSTQSFDVEDFVSNSVYASNLKRPEPPLDRTDPHLIAAMTASLRAGGPNTFAATPVTTPTATGQARQRRDQRAAARAAAASPVTITAGPAPACHPADHALETTAQVEAPAQRRVLYPLPRRQQRTRQQRPAPFRPGMFLTTN